MKIFLFLITIHFFYCTLLSQVTIVQSDMPTAGEIFTVSRANDINSYLDSTGVDYLWDFSDLQLNSQQKDTIFPSSSTEMVYAAVFFNMLAAKGFAFPGNIPQISITDNYDFFKSNISYYSRAGMGAKINGISIPMKYDNPELYFTLPLVFGNTDSSFSSFGITLPSIGYYGQTVIRYNYTDGWGTIITPFGTFAALRVRSDVYITDTVYYDSYSYGISIPRFQNEYKWVAPGMGLPVLSVTKTTMQTTVLYQDSVMQNSINNPEDLKISISIYPNPATNHIILYFTQELKDDFSIQISDQTGRYIFNNFILTKTGEKEYLVNFNGNALSEGVYFITVNHSGKTVSEKFIVQ